MRGSVDLGNKADARGERTSVFVLLPQPHLIFGGKGSHYFLQAPAHLDFSQ